MVAPDKSKVPVPICLKGTRLRPNLTPVKLMWLSFSSFSLQNKFHTYFDDMTSTSDDLMDWLPHQQEDILLGWKLCMPGSAIFNIVQNDTMDFFPNCT